MTLTSDLRAIEPIPFPKTGERVAICVCTCLRPTMLAACLNSLSKLSIPPDVEPYIIIVDNDPAGSAAEVVTDQSRLSPHLTFYISEPRRGVPFARNAALEAAQRIGAEWIAFIDDDEIADAEWLVGLMAPEYRDAAVLMGRQERLYPSKMPFWGLRQEKKLEPEGVRMKTAYTYGVRFSMKLVEAGLRFNEALGLMGGEDQEFFSAAHKRGFEIRRTQRALTREFVHPERLTYRAQVGRSYWCAASDLRRLAVERGKLRAVLIKVHTVPLSAVFGILETAVSPLFAVAGIDAFKRRALAGGKKIAKGAGRLAAMFGYLPEPYRKVVGT